MAIVGGQDDEELNNPNGKPAGGGAEGGFVSGGTGQGATTKTGGAAAPTSSGGYTNLSSYLQANQGSGATTGKAAENVVDQAGGAAKAAQGAYGEAGNQEIDQATAAVGPSKARDDSIRNGGARVDPREIARMKAGVRVADPALLGAIRDGIYSGGSAVPETAYTGTKATAGEYSGPTEDQYSVSYGGGADTGHLSGNSMALQNAAVGANQNVYDRAEQARGGHSGRAALLQEAYKQPSYTKGENSLDSFLAGGTPGGQSALSGASGVAKGVAGGYSKLNDTLNQKIVSGKAQADTTNASSRALEREARGQTGKVQAAYDDAYNIDSQDQTAHDAYAAAIADRAKTVADQKAAADAQATADLAASKTFSENNPVLTSRSPEQDRQEANNSIQRAIDKMGDGTVVGGGYKTLEQMFPHHGQSKSNPLIPDAVPNPIPVNPVGRIKPETVQAPNITQAPITASDLNPLTPLNNLSKGKKKKNILDPTSYL